MCGGRRRMMQRTRMHVDRAGFGEGKHGRVRLVEISVQKTMYFSSSPIICEGNALFYRSCAAACNMFASVRVIRGNSSHVCMVATHVYRQPRSKHSRLLQVVSCRSLAFRHSRIASYLSPEPLQLVPPQRRVHEPGASEADVIAHLSKTISVIIQTAGR